MLSNHGQCPEIPSKNPYQQSSVENHIRTNQGQDKIQSGGWTSRC